MRGSLMSRTDKDRPYWVQINDKTIPQECSHNHTVFGIYQTDYWGKIKHTQDYCTEHEILTWNSSQDFYYFPCRRYPIVSLSGDKRPHDCRLKLYRRRRRDFLKGQVKKYNSNPDLHDDIEFMNEDVFEALRDERSHRKNL